MVIWSRVWSWSKVLAAGECPLRMQFAIQKVSRVDLHNYWSELGLATQKIFELFFNQGLNMNPKLRTPKTLRIITERVLGSERWRKLDISHPGELDKDDLKKEIREDVQSGLKHLEKADLLRYPTEAEFWANGTLRGLRIGGMLDFIVKKPNELVLLDGKGSKEENADERQVQFYALVLMGQGRRPKSAGLMYWKHGYRPVDVTNRGLRTYIDEHLSIVMPLLKQVEKGASEPLEARPSKKTCRYCPYRFSCPESMYQDDGVYVETGEVNFGEDT